jgi:hypothetical protein
MEKEKNSLVIHAERELKLAGIDQKDADYGGMLYDAVMELIRVFAKQGHSGFSAMRTLQLFKEVASYKNLMPIGTTKDEWVDVSETIGRPCWQNKRNSEMFSETAGETWYNVGDKTKIFTKDNN